MTSPGVQNMSSVVITTIIDATTIATTTRQRKTTMRMDSGSNVTTVEVATTKTQERAKLTLLERAADVDAPLWRRKSRVVV